MSWWDAVLLVSAGILGGLTGSIAGLASVATYPALLLVGLPLITANVTNTVALVFNGIGSVLGSRPELKGQGAWLKRIMPIAALGGVAGAALLLSTPAEGFEKIVPILLGLAAVVIAVPNSRAARGRGEDRHRRRTATVMLESTAIFLISVYGGYFGPYCHIRGSSGVGRSVSRCVPGRFFRLFLGSCCRRRRVGGVNVEPPQRSEEVRG